MEENRGDPAAFVDVGPADAQGRVDYRRNVEERVFFPPGAPLSSMSAGGASIIFSAISSGLAIVAVQRMNWDLLRRRRRPA